MRFVLLFSIVLFCQNLAAQKGISGAGAEISFLKKNHDFGKIQMEINYAKTRFTFVNTGSKALYISNVVSSCGCTTPDWSRDSVSPGDSGFVDARYETINRPGEFKKTVTVYSNAVNAPFVHLDISGNVIKSAGNPLAEATPDYGKVYFDMPTINFEPIYDNAIDTVKVHLINGTIYATDFSPVQNLPAFCRVLNMPTSLDPNESATVSVVLDGKLMSGYGFRAFEIPVATNNAVMPYTGLFVSYTRKQYFPKMNKKQLEKAPHLKLDKTQENFGDRRSGDVLSTTFSFTNTGKSNLEFKEIFPECTCVRVSFPKKILAPGESMVMAVDFDTVTKHGLSTQSIWLVTNDPTQPEMHIYVKANLPKYEQKCATCPAGR